MAFGKGDGLGVLEAYFEMDLGLRGIRKALRNKDRERGIKDALNLVKDVRIRLQKSKVDAQKLRKETRSIARLLTDTVLPLIEEDTSKQKGRTRRGP